jgi:pseudouridine-5'-phosphate glycosidase
VTERFLVSREVREALRRGRPVVALETTLVTHGLPHPDGVRAAAALEAEIRENRSVPATIGVLDGKIRVGLTPAELARLAAAPDVAKLNPSNLAAQLAAGAAGSTTVAATLFVAHDVGIEVFATGGIGGVHRDAAASGDVSADLTALARYPVAVVCSGAKAVLDIARTVEALETLGVPSYGVGTDRFPSFYRRDSGLPVDRRFDSVPELAAAVRVHLRLGLGTGVVVANPIPPGQEMPPELYQGALDRAIADASRDGIRGRAVTPYLLERLRVLTEGKSVFSNRALLLHNARVAAALAAALAPSRPRTRPRGLPRARAGTRAASRAGTR